MSSIPSIEMLADDAWLVRFGSCLDPDDNARVHALAERLRSMSLAWLVDLVPAYASLGVFFDLAQVGADVVRERLLGETARLPDRPLTERPTSRLLEIPVAYGGSFGVDLADAAEALGMPPDELVQRHSAGHYTVAMIGFAPGFPYLSGLDPALALPRLATPRTHVPAGSVAIGGAQTGIYPQDSPGGWRIVGRTPLTLFDPLRAQPSTLLPGDQVRFRAIDAATFAALTRSQ